MTINGEVPLKDLGYAWRVEYLDGGGDACAQEARHVQQTPNGVIMLWVLADPRLTWVTIDIPGDRLLGVPDQKARNQRRRDECDMMIPLSRVVECRRLNPTIEGVEQ